MANQTTPNTEKKTEPVKAESAKTETVVRTSSASAPAESNADIAALRDVIDRQAAELSAMREMIDDLAETRRGAVAPGARLTLIAKALNVAQCQAKLDESWPSDAEREKPTIVAKTFEIIPIGKSVEHGLPAATVHNCSDETDAKAIYIKHLKLNGNFPLKIKRVADPEPTASGGGAA